MAREGKVPPRARRPFQAGCLDERALAEGAPHQAKTDWLSKFDSVLKVHKLQKFSEAGLETFGRDDGLGLRGKELFVNTFCKCCSPRFIGSDFSY